jgi:micrococcal nuclease
MSSGWNDNWSQAPKPPRRKGGMGALALGVGAVAALVTGSTHWKQWFGSGQQPLGQGPTAVLQPNAQDRESGLFTICKGTHRVTCVVDGDTIWYQGTKIRIADINAPEISHPQCDSEEALGDQARDRLLALLNAGPFTIASTESRDTDRYGRALRSLTRGGHSLGEALVQEGLAERWTGHRRNWCN